MSAFSCIPYLLVISFAIVWIILLASPIEGLKCNQCGPDTRKGKDDPDFSCTDKFPPVEVDCSELFGKNEWEQGEQYTVYCLILHNSVDEITTRRCQYDYDREQPNDCKKIEYNDINGTEQTRINCACSTDNCNEKPINKVVKELPLKSEQMYRVPKCYECGPDPSLDMKHPNSSACTDRFPPVEMDCAKIFKCQPGKTCVGMCAISYAKETEVTARSCYNVIQQGYTDLEDGCVREMNELNVTVTTCICSADNCNGKSMDELLQMLPLIVV